MLPHFRSADVELPDKFRFLRRQFSSDRRGYDPNDDVVEVALDGLAHMIRRPREIYLDTGLGGLTSLDTDLDDYQRQAPVPMHPIEADDFVLIESAVQSKRSHRGVCRRARR